MAMAMPASLRLSIILLSLWFLASMSAVVEKKNGTGRKFALVNRCGYTVWAGLLGTSVVAGGGVALEAGQSTWVVMPAHWSGRVWGRSGCNSKTGRCLTGDCRGGGVHCAGTGGVPPATLAEFTLDGDGGKDFYDVSLVDGFNLPLSISPIGGSGSCGSPSCSKDVNRICPAELQVKNTNVNVIACKSACLRFQTSQYCCTGSLSTKCPPNNYSKIFKAACPSAYSYAEDDLTSTFTCSNPTAYTITFCP